ncbi:MAG TPA: 23S rRNA (cytidine(2498)-2'-O)-methyltransferase RlmM [Thiobacillaceae bacterium]|nr:23S rRNA (cytidine(2498)-2'-O)-methyltransferase RlmM [Thiobacillaceae bacterium]
MTAGLLLYCRAGFEKECAQDITHAAGQLGVAGWCKAGTNAGYVLFYPAEQAGFDVLQRRLDFSTLIFSRQMVFVTGPCTDLPAGDRATPLLTAARSWHSAFSAFWLETADTNEAKETLGFCRRFEPHLKRALEQAGLLNASKALSRLHVFFVDSSTAYVGYSHPGNSSDWPMGIPRLKMPRQAPSRSTLKLAEAISELLTPAEQEKLRAGQRAVDLGAAPGGWTWQLASRGIRVLAVDNGTMAQAVMDTGFVEHLRADGFTFRPRARVDWLVCDMVDKPARVADLVGRWFERGDCRNAIFNLKLPMKHRYEEARVCLERLSTRLARLDQSTRLKARQLFHDREEISCVIVGG